MTEPKTCALILPCYNPPDKWAENVVKHYHSIKAKIDLPLSLVIVNDGSTDNFTQADIRYLKQHLPDALMIDYSENRGKGYALRKGVKAAGADITIYTDIDFPYTSESIYKLYNALRLAECDVAIGIKDESYYKQVPTARRIISKWLRKMIRTSISIPVSDTQCGLKGFNKKGKEHFINTKINRYLFDLEFIKSAYNNKLICKSIEVELRENIVFRNMSYSVLIPEMFNFIRLTFMRS